MAEAFLDQIAGDRYAAASAGTEPSPHPHPEVVEAMRQIGIDLSGPGRLLTDEMVVGAAKVVGMGCDVQEACPALRFPLEDWDLQDPKGKPMEQVVQIRDEIAARVLKLVERLDSGLATP